MNNLTPKTRMSKTDQAGIATIILVALIGIALTAASFSIIHTSRYAQEKQIAVHAAVHAESGLWTGVESFRRYLLTLDETELLALAGQSSLDIGLDSHYGAMAASQFSVSDLGGGQYQVSAQIANIHAAAKSSSAIQIVYEIATSNGVGSVALPASMDFYDDLDVRGEIIFLTPTNTKANINVDGNITIQNINVTPLGQVNTTGSVTINSAVSTEAIYANGNVSLTQAAKADSVKTLGNLELSGGGYVSNAWVNGSIYSRGNGQDSLGYTSLSLNAIGSIDLGQGTHKLVKTGDTLDIDWLNNIEDGRAVGDIEITNSGTGLGTLITEGKITCPGTGYNNFTSLSANGTNVNCSTSAVSGATPAHDIDVMEPNTPYTMQPFIVDVWQLRSYANYIMEYETAGGNLKVTVNNVNNVTNGSEFYVGNYSGNGVVKKSYLCTEAPNNGNCTAATITDIAMCLGESSQNECLTYVNRGNTKHWLIDGKSTVPGVLWFDGDVEVSTTHGYSTILSAGDISTSGSLYLQSVNYAGYGPVCTGVATDFNDTGVQARYLAAFATQYPVNLCNTSNQLYQPSSLGNIAFAAGGYPPTSNNTYSGGNITLDQANELFGAMLAGSLLTTQGSTTVHGFLTAAALNTPETNSEDNSLGASTTIDTRSLPSTYDPNTVPDMSGTCTSNCGPSNPDDKVKVLWARYL